MVAEKCNPNAILLRQDRGIFTITLNVPTIRNALTQPEMLILADRLREASLDPTVKVVVLAGAGEHFSAGGNVHSFGGVPKGEEALTPNEARERRIQRLIRCAEVSLLLHTMAKPTVALIRGSAAGAGMVYALACDFRLGSTTMVMTTAFARVGLSGDMGVSLLLQRLVGPALARELLFFSERLPASEALAKGLVNRIYPDEEFDHEAELFVEKLHAGPLLAYAAMKQNLVAAREVTVAEAIEVEARNMVRTLESADCQEAAAAFLERRQPRFIGA
jgi:2-(1,2-epoxy-1,2-dihydrophenyl)acetyl-CoA isomerase